MFGLFFRRSRFLPTSGGGGGGGGGERLTTAAESVAMVLIDWRRGKPLPACSGSFRRSFLLVLADCGEAEAEEESAKRVKEVATLVAVYLHWRRRSGGAGLKRRASYAGDRRGEFRGGGGEGNIKAKPSPNTCQFLTKLRILCL